MAKKIDFFKNEDVSQDVDFWADIRQIWKRTVKEIKLKYNWNKYWKHIDFNNISCEEVGRLAKNFYGKNSSDELDNPLVRSFYLSPVLVFQAVWKNVDPSEHMNLVPFIVRGFKEEEYRKHTCDAPIVLDSEKLLKVNYLLENISLGSWHGEDSYSRGEYISVLSRIDGLSVGAMKRLTSIDGDSHYVPSTAWGIVKDVEMAQVLIDNGYSKQDKKAVDALVFAREKDVLLCLLKNGFNINEQDSVSGLTPLERLLFYPFYSSEKKEESYRKTALSAPFFTENEIEKKAKFFVENGAVVDFASSGIRKRLRSNKLGRLISALLLKRAKEQGDRRLLRGLKKLQQENLSENNYEIEKAKRLEKENKRISVDIDEINQKLQFVNPERLEKARMYRTIRRTVSHAAARQLWEAEKHRKTR